MNIFANQFRSEECKALTEALGFYAHDYPYLIDHTSTFELLSMAVQVGYPVDHIIQIPSESVKTLVLEYLQGDKPLNTVSGEVVDRYITSRLLVYKNPLIHEMQSRMMEIQRPDFISEAEQSLVKLLDKFRDVSMTLPDTGAYIHVYAMEPEKLLSPAIMQSVQGANTASAFHGRQLNAMENVYLTAIDLPSPKLTISAPDSNMEPLPVPLLDYEEEVTERSDIQLVPVERRIANLYIPVIRHRLTTPASGDYALLLINHKVAGLCSFISTNDFLSLPPKTVLLRQSFGVAHSLYRFEHLMTDIALQKSTVMKATNGKARMWAVVSERIMTTEYTRYPESKRLRSKMKLTDRTKKNDIYQLRYETEWKQEQSLTQILSKFLKKERQRNKSRKAR